MTPQRYGSRRRAVEERVDPLDTFGGLLADIAAEMSPVVNMYRAGLFEDEYPTTPFATPRDRMLSLLEEPEYQRYMNNVASSGMGATTKVGRAAKALPAPRTKAEAVAKDVLKMRAAGKAEKVTDEMMAAADPQYLFENTPLPMGEASRMARAKEMGFDTDAYHATRATEAFDKFEPGWRGSNYFAATPRRAELGALGGSQDNAFLAQPSFAPSSVAVMPVKVRGDDINGLRPPRNAWEEIPQIGFEHTVDDAASRVGGKYWYDVYDEIQTRPPRFDDAGNIVDWGAYEYNRKPYPAQEYTSDATPWQSSERMLPGYNLGSDVKSLERVAKDGQHGFLVSDEAGASIVAGLDMPIRSRFARFDPEFRHLRNLSAGFGGLGILSLLEPEQEVP